MLLLLLGLILLFICICSSMKEPFSSTMAVPTVPKKAKTCPANIRQYLGVDEFLMPGDELLSPNHRYSLVLKRNSLFVRDNITGEQYSYINSVYDTVLTKFGLSSDYNGLILGLQYVSQVFYITDEVLYKNESNPPTKMFISNGGVVVVYRGNDLVYMLDIMANIKRRYD